MKWIPAVIVFLTLTHESFCQVFTGDWNGLLKVNGVQLRIVFHVVQDGNTYTSTMDSPDQGATGIKVEETVVHGDSIMFKMPALRIVYAGTTMADGSVSGTFAQGGQKLSLTLYRHEVEKEVMSRPQEPQPPYPYLSEEVEIYNEKDKVTLAGTITIPDKTEPYDIVILISGSGPQDRNETLMGHKPFLVLADHLSRHGMAVLRYDDRGTAKSTGIFRTATSVDFASDVEAIIKYIKLRDDIMVKRIGLIGHSEGGIIAPMVASENKDVDFIVLMAGTGIRGDLLLLQQQQLIGKASGVSDSDLALAYEINKGAYDLLASTAQDSLAQVLNAYFKQILADHPQILEASGMGEGAYLFSMVSQLVAPWMKYFLTYDPAIALAKVTCPVLAINGDKDLQVPAEINLNAIRKTLINSGNNHVTISKLKGLNHLFQECSTGSPSEYAEIEQTLSPQVLKLIADWITEIGQ